jgi:hypothetical protein
LPFNEKSLKNLIPIQPGHTRNPNGKPKGVKSITSHLRDLLERQIQMGSSKVLPGGGQITAGQAVAVALIAGAIEGDTAKIRELLDRIDGTSKQVLEIENNEKPDADKIYSDIRSRLSQARKNAIKPKKSNSKKNK